MTEAKPNPTIVIRALESIQGSLRAAADDCQDEEGTVRDGGEIDAGMIDGALFHAEDAVRQLKLLRDAVRT